MFVCRRTHELWTTERGRKANSCLVCYAVFTLLASSLAVATRSLALQSVQLLNHPNLNCVLCYCFLKRAHAVRVHRHRFIPSVASISLYAVHCSAVCSLCTLHSSHINTSRKTILASPRRRRRCRQRRRQQQATKKIVNSFLSISKIEIAERQTTRRVGRERKRQRAGKRRVKCNRSRTKEQKTTESSYTTHKRSTSYPQIHKGHAAWCVASACNPLNKQTTPIHTHTRTRTRTHANMPVYGRVRRVCCFKSHRKSYTNAYIITFDESFSLLEH